MFILLKKISMFMVKGGALWIKLKLVNLLLNVEKREKLTQLQLAGKLNITDRAISKWENGRSLPDSSSMIEDFLD